MRRFFLIILFLLVLTLPAHAEDEPLFPAMAENGKWGYMNAQAEWIIAPQFDGADDFRGNYAVALDLSGNTEDHEGIIDRTGEWVVPPAYAFDPGYDGYYYGGYDTGIWLCMGSDPVTGQARDGFFDIPTGYFSGPRWDYVGAHCTGDSRLIPVNDPVTLLGGFADRSTGEIVIPCRYDLFPYPPYFHEGVAVVYEWVPGEDPDENVAEWPILINMQGDVIPLPEGIHVDEYAEASEGCIGIVNEDGLYGYADLTGQVVIEPQFLTTWTFQDGLAAVQITDTEYGYIDHSGSIVLRGYEHASAFSNGWAIVVLNGQARYIDKAGNVCLVPYNENGLGWYNPTRNAQTYRETWMLIDREGNAVTPAYILQVFDERATETSRTPVRDADGWHYLDETGKVAIEGPYTQAHHFINGLAWVRMGDREGYIDLDGNEVYFWDHQDINR